MPLTHHLLLHPAKNPGVPHLHQDAAQSHIALSPDHRPRHPEPTFSKPPAPEQWLQRPRAVPDPLPVSLNIWYVDMAHRLISSVLLPQMRVSNPVTLCPHPILLAQRPASLPGLRLPAATLAPKASSKRSHLVTPVTSCLSSPKPPAPGSHQREDSIVHPAWPFSRIYLGNFPVWVLSLGQDLRPHIAPLSASSLSHITTGSSQKRPSLVACACPTLGAMLPLSVHGSPAAPAQPWRGGGATHGAQLQGTPPLFPRPRPQFWPQAPSLLPTLPACAQLSPSSTTLHAIAYVASVPILRVKSRVQTMAFKPLTLSVTPNTLHPCNPCCLSGCTLCSPASLCLHAGHCLASRPPQLPPWPLGAPTHPAAAHSKAATLRNLTDFTPFCHRGALWTRGTNTYSSYFSP